MRKDFSKLLVERSRIKQEPNDYRSWRRAKISPADVILNDDNELELSERAALGTPTKQGYRPRNSYERKILDENLNPLKNFLRSRVGHNWDDLFSEISEVNDFRSAIGHHILEHLFHYVDLNVIEIDGQLYKFFPFGQGSKRLRLVTDKRSVLGNNDFYVDPNTRLLCKFPGEEPKQLNLEGYKGYLCQLKRERKQYKQNQRKLKLQQKSETESRLNEVLQYRKLQANLKKSVVRSLNTSSPKKPLDTKTKSLTLSSN